MDRIEKILKTNGLRTTDSRVIMLQTLFAHEHAVSYQILETQLQDFDRATIYRTLTTFQEKNIIHRVIDDEGGAKYALNYDAAEKTLGQNHVHFKCTICNLTTCLPCAEIPFFKLPDGFAAERYDFLIHGVCNMCRNANTPTD